MRTRHFALCKPSLAALRRMQSRPTPFEQTGNGWDHIGKVEARQTQRGLDECMNWRLPAFGASFVDDRNPANTMQAHLSSRTSRGSLVRQVIGFSVITLKQGQPHFVPTRTSFMARSRPVTIRWDAGCFCSLTTGMAPTWWLRISSAVRRQDSSRRIPRSSYSLHPLLWCPYPILLSRLRPEVNQTVCCGSHVPCRGLSSSGIEVRLRCAARMLYGQTGDIAL